MAFIVAFANFVMFASFVELAGFKQDCITAGAAAEAGKRTVVADWVAEEEEDLGCIAADIA